MKQLVGAFTALTMIVVFALPAGATWSIVGADPETGQVGVAIASCVPASLIDTENGLDTVALVPTKGAGVTQALLNVAARDEIERLVGQDASADEVIAAIVADSFDELSSERQHAVVLLDGGTAGFTGADTFAVALDRQAMHVSAQGNILVSNAVIDDSIAAFEAGASKPLADRLVDALEAGSLAGGDSRCGTQTALFAHVTVIDGDGTRSDPNIVALTYGVPEVDDGDNGDNPVALLAADFRSGTRFGDSIEEADIDLVSLIVPMVLVVGFSAGLVMLWRRYTSGSRH